MPGNSGQPSATVPGPEGTLDQWLGYIEAIHSAEIDLGLDRVLLVLRRLMRGRPRARVITVAGTNGKGSTVAALESLLIASGQTVGCYTSPHLFTYNERVRLSGGNASDEQLVAAFEKVESARGAVSLTYFEFGTLAALLIMEQAGVDVMLMEVGLGGRLDAVNVLDPDLAIITSVDLDHTSWLGEDRNTIGFEKAGILRPGQLAIYGDTDPPASVLQQASAQKVRLYRLEQDYYLGQGSQSDAESTCFRFPAGGRSLPLPDDRLPLNSLAAAAMAAILLELPLTDDQIAQVLGKVSLTGRFERAFRQPAVYLDVGHNPHAAGWLAGRLASLRGDTTDGKVWAVYAGLEDKDSAGVAAALAGAVDHWLVAGLTVPRGLSAEALAARMMDQIDSDLVEVAGTVPQAITRALGQAAAEDLVLVFGSFFTIAEAKQYFYELDTATT